MKTGNIAYDGIKFKDGALVQSHSRDGVQGAPYVSFTVDVAETLQMTALERVILHELGEEYEFPKCTTCGVPLDTSFVNSVIRVLNDIVAEMEGVQKRMAEADMYGRIREAIVRQERVNNGEDLA